MFFSKPKTADPRRRSLLGAALNPDLGAGLRPIGESARVFVNLIAMLFAMNGLFPKDHPAFANGSTVRLTLTEVIRIAWNNLTFTEKDVPKILFFFAVVSCIGMTVLTVIVGIFSLFVGTAHAQATAPGSAFFSVDAGTDLAQNWIDYMFQGQPLLTTYNQATANDIPTVTSAGNAMGSINVQCAMITALGFYSDAVLMVAALILFYHLSAMVVETAHHGQVMGKRGNQVWAPIRLVVAVGLLVPIGAGATTSACPNGGTAGLNSAQYITIKVAELGSGLASNAWAKFVGAMQGAQFQFLQPSTPQVNQVVEDIFLMEGCKAAWNHFVNAAAADVPGLGQVMPIPDPITPTGDTQTSTGQFWHYTPGTVGNPIADAKDACGYIYLPAQSKTSANDFGSDSPVTGIDPNTTTLKSRDDIFLAHQDALETAIQDIHNIVQNGTAGGAQPLMSYFVPDWNGSLADGPPPDNAIFRNEVAKYAQQLNSGLNSVFANTNTDLIKDSMTALGWIGAGVWMNVIARDQGALANAVYDGMPRTQMPQLVQHNIDSSTSLVRDTENAYYAMQNWMDKSSTAADQAGAPSLCDMQGATGNAGVEEVDDSKTGELLTLLKALDTAAQHFGLWSDPNYTCTNSNGGTQQLFTLGMQFQSGNPFGELASYGDKAMQTALWSMNMMFLSVGANVIGSMAAGIAAGVKNPNSVAASLTQAAAGGVAGLGSVGAVIFGFLATIFLTIGVTLAYVVPLTPFIHFFFAALAWGLVLLEGIIAMPLVALAHLNPEGDGLPGGLAKQAYFMLLGLFLRPILIIFAFIASLLMFVLSMFLLNKLYAITVVGTGGMSHGYGTVSKIIFTVIYVFIAYACVTNCFKLVDSLPEAVFRWISINIQHQRIADGGGVLQSAAGPVTAIAAQQGMQTISSASAKVGETAREIGKGGAAALSNLGKASGSGVGAGTPPPPPLPTP